MKYIQSKSVFPLMFFGILVTISNSVFSKPKVPDSQVTYLQQGWDAVTRADFYQTTQGSRMLPYKWFINLEHAVRRQKFIAPSNMRKMGYLVDERSNSNPDRLPVGFAKDIDPIRGDKVGLTCAACHTGQLEFNGSVVRIDGGQSLSDLEALQNGILASLEATLADDEKFNRFADKVIGELASDASRNTLFSEVVEQREWWYARIIRSKGIEPHGPGRTDALTVIGNEVACAILDIAANCEPNNANAPSQYPFLWDTPDFDWVQYTASVHSPLGRNVGEVTGVYAEAELDGSYLASGFPVVNSSADIENLTHLEELLKQLRSPAWPEEILGEIDQTLAAEGGAIYASECSGCHTENPQPRTDPNKFGLTFAKVNFDTPLYKLQTDSSAALSFATRRVYPGQFFPIASYLGIVGPDGKIPVLSMLGLFDKAIILQYFTSEMLTDIEQLRYLGFRELLSPTIAQITTYKARPLNGIAFTAPFLHNGSVASIYELLLPPDQRLVEFHVGSQQFDPVHLGYSTEREAHTLLFDTMVSGNHNSGHIYGTDLSYDERMAVIEYLKTL